MKVSYSSTHVSFRFLGPKVDAAEIHRVMNIDDGQISKDGHCWIVHSNLSDDQTIERHMQELCQLLLPKRERLDRMSEIYGRPEFFVSEFIGIQSKSGALALSCSGETLDILCQLKAKLQIDVHFECCVTQASACAASDS